jgi:hypothetical protein
MMWSAALAVFAPGCGDSGGSSVSNSNSDSQSGTDGTGTDATGATEPTGGSNSMSEGTTGGSMSDSQSGTTGAEGSMSESLSGTVSSGVESDSNSGGTTTDTTGMLSGGGETTGTSTGEPIDCATFDNEDDCVDAGCMALGGQKFVTDGADWCIDPPSFLACTEPTICDDVITTACKGAVKYQLPSACMPADFKPCTPPPDQGMDGYKECQ